MYNGEDPPAHGLWLDDAIGAILDKIETMGVKNNTLVVYMPDHQRRGKGTVYEGSHVAMVLRWPAKIKPGQIIGAPVRNIDLVPTFLHSAGVAQTALEKLPIDGKTFLPQLTGSASWSARDELDVYIEVGKSRSILHSSGWKIITTVFSTNDLKKVEDAHGVTCSNTKKQYNNGTQFVNIPVCHDRNNNPAKLSAFAAWEDQWAKRASKFFPAYYDITQVYFLPGDPLEQHNVATLCFEQLKCLQQKLRKQMQTQAFEYGVYTADDAEWSAFNDGTCAPDALALNSTLLCPGHAEAPTQAPPAICRDDPGTWTAHGVERGCATYVKPGDPRCGESVSTYNQFGWNGYYCQRGGMGGEKCCAAACGTCPAGSKPLQDTDPVNYPDFTGIETVLFGMNVCGFDFVNDGPGQEDPDAYVVPSYDAVDYLIDKKNVQVIRLPITWERLQKSLSGPLAMVDGFDELVSYITGKGIYVIIDPHNDGDGLSFNGQEVTQQSFVNLWTLLALQYRTCARCIFGLYNEPRSRTFDPSNQDTSGEMVTTWMTWSQGAVDAIRQTGAKNLILVPGLHYTGTRDWAGGNWWGLNNTGNGMLAGIKDPGNNLAFDLHSYFDKDYNGKEPGCASFDVHPYAADAPGAYGGLQWAIDWARAAGVKLFISEMAMFPSSTTGDEVCKQKMRRYIERIVNASDVFLGFAVWGVGLDDAYDLWSNKPLNIDWYQLPTPCQSSGMCDKAALYWMSPHSCNNDFAVCCTCQNRTAVTTAVTTAATTAATAVTATTAQPASSGTQTSFTGETRVSKSRKHVLFVMMDDLRLQIGADRVPGTHPMSTPNIDALIGTSMYFPRAACQMALCAPSRASVLTSRRPDTTKVWDLHSFWRDVGGDFTSLPQLFQQRGYKVYGAGKIMHPGSSSGCRSKTNSLAARECDDTDATKWTDYYHAPNFELYEHTGPSENEFVRNNCKRCGKSWVAVEKAVEDRYPLPDTQLADYASKIISEAFTPEQATFLALGFRKPHLPFVFPESFLDQYPFEEINVPANQQPPANMPNAAWQSGGELRHWPDIKNISAYQGAQGQVLPEETTRHLRRAYYASVTYADHELGKVLQAVDNAYPNARDDVIVTLIGDHVRLALALPLMHDAPLNNRPSCEHSLFPKLPYFCFLMSRFVFGVPVPSINILPGILYEKYYADCII